MSDHGFQTPGETRDCRHSSKCITDLLVAWKQGDQQSGAELWSLVYHELRRIAAQRLRRERHNHTLQVTGLVHEAYLQLVGQNTDFQSRYHFLAVASQIMRRILIDYARRKQASKRGSYAAHVPLNDSLDSPVPVDYNLLLIDEALSRLEDFDPRSAKVVELRFFGGLSNEEISGVLTISPATVQRDWISAKAWIFHQLKSAG